MWRCDDVTLVLNRQGLCDPAVLVFAPFFVFLQEKKIYRHTVTSS